MTNCEREANLGLIWTLGPAVYCGGCKAFLSNITYLPSNYQAGSPLINIQYAPDLCKNLSLQCYLVATVIHIQSTRSQREIYGLGSSVGIATELRAGRSGIESRWGRDFQPVQTGPGAHPAFCTMGTGGKVRPGRAADHSPPSSAAVMEE